VAPECFWSFSFHAQDVRCTVKRHKRTWRGRLATSREESDVSPPATMGSVTELWPVTKMERWHPRSRPDSLQPGTPHRRSRSHSSARIPPDGRNSTPVGVRCQLLARRLRQPTSVRSQGHSHFANGRQGVLQGIFLLRDSIWEASVALWR